MIGTIIGDIFLAVMFVVMCVVVWIIAWHYFENWMGNDSDSKKGKGRKK